MAPRDNELLLNVESLTVIVIVSLVTTGLIIYRAISFTNTLRVMSIDNCGTQYLNSSLHNNIALRLPPISISISFI